MIDMEIYEDYKDSFCESTYPYNLETWFWLEHGVSEDGVQEYLDYEKEERERKLKESEEKIVQSRITVAQLISILSEMDEEAVVCVGDWGSIRQIKAVKAEDLSRYIGSNIYDRNCFNCQTEKVVVIR